MQRKPKIVVAGLLPAQSHRLTKALQQVNFVYLDVEKRGTKIPQGDLYVVWARFVSHLFSKKIYDIAEGNVITHHGGITDLIRVLQERFSDVQTPT